MIFNKTLRVGRATSEKKQELLRKHFDQNNQIENNPLNLIVMNIRQIKLALTVGLINAGQNSNALNGIKDLMLSFKEVGAYLGASLTGKLPLNEDHVKESYAIQFENCVLDIDLVRNPQTSNQFVQQFRLH